MIQKRRSLHSGHVRCRLTLYGAITYAPPRGVASFTLLYGRVEVGEEKNRKPRNKESTCSRVTRGADVAISRESMLQDRKLK